MTEETKDTAEKDIEIGIEFSAIEIRINRYHMAQKLLRMIETLAVDIVGGGTEKEMADRRFTIGLRVGLLYHYSEAFEFQHCTRRYVRVRVLCGAIDEGTFDALSALSREIAAANTELQEAKELWQNNLTPSTPS